MNDTIHIEPVRTRRDRRDFVKLPVSVYRDDPHHVQPPFLEERARIHPNAPYFEHADAVLLLARDALGSPVGRISAQLDERLAAPDHDGERTGHFGFLEAENEPTLRALLEAAETWLRQRAVTRVEGPYSFSINEEAGLLVAGHGDPPRLMMNYSRPWYAAVLERAGFSKAKDLLAFRVPVETEPDRRLREMASRAEEIPGLRERPLDRRRFEAEIRSVAALFNDAWAGNWGFVPMTDREISALARSLRPLAPAEFVRFVEIAGRPVGMLVVLPDVNEALSGLGGRLFPLGWERLLWRLKIRGLSRSRAVLMGITGEWGRDLRGAAIAALLVDRVREPLRRAGYRELEMSWILEDNVSMIRLIEMVGGSCYKRYRIYEKSLG